MGEQNSYGGDVGLTSYRYFFTSHRYFFTSHRYFFISYRCNNIILIFFHIISIRSHWYDHVYQYKLTKSIAQTSVLGDLLESQQELCLIISTWSHHIDMIISIGINWANLLYWLQSWMTIQRVNMWYELNGHIDVIISYRYDHISSNGPFPLKVKWQMAQSFICLLLYSTVIWVNWSYRYDNIDTITLTLIE